MPNRRPRLRWLPYCNSFLLGATVAFCYDQYFQQRPPALSPAAEPLIQLPTASATAAGSSPSPTVKVPPAQVLKTPPLIARAAPGAPKKGAASTAKAPAAEPPRSRFAGGGLEREHAPIDFGAPPSTASANSAEPAFEWRKPQPNPSQPNPSQASAAPGAKGGAAKGGAAKGGAAKGVSAAMRPAASAPTAPARGSKAAGDAAHSQSSASSVAAAEVNPGAPAASGRAASTSAAAPAEPASTAGATSSAPSPGPSTGAAGAAPSSPSSPSAEPLSGAGGAGSTAGGGPASTSSAASSAQPAARPPAQPTRKPEDLSLAPAAGSTLPARAEAGISSRSTTSNTNALSPAPPEAGLPRTDVSAPLPSLSGAAFGAAAIAGGAIASRLGAEPLLETQGVGSTLASGGEVPGQNFTLTSDTPLLYDTERGISLAQGKVTLGYGAFRAVGKRGVVYLNATPRIARLSDDLTITARVNGREQTFTGQSLTFNLDTGRWELTNIHATFARDLFPPGQVLEPLFLRDGRVFGQDQDVGGSKFKFSSCDRDHYYLSTRQVNFFRDERGNPDRIVLRHNALYVLGHKILELPNFVYSLQGDRSRRIGLQPQVGRNAVDGFFAKTILDLSANAHRTDSLLVDTLQKRGLGLGFNRELAGGAGLLYLYGVSGRGLSSGSNGSSAGRELDARLQRAFNIGPSLRSTINLDSSSNNTLAGAGRSNTNGEFELNFAPQNSGTSGSLQLHLNNSKDPFSTYTQRSSTLDLSRQFGSGWDASLNTSYNGNTSSSAGLSGESSSSRQSILDNTAILNRHANLFDAALTAELHNDLTGQSQHNGAYALERLPELLLRTDTRRLGLDSGALGKALEGNLVVSMGEFNEPATLMRLSRTHFEFEPRSRTLRLIDTRGLRSSFDLDGGFGQNAYSDNTARYDYNTNIVFNTEVGRRRLLSYDSELGNLSEDTAPLQLRASYLKVKAVGYTPFQFDFLPPSEVVDARGIFQPSSKLRLEVAGGRDLQNGISRDLTGTVRLAPSQAIGINLTTAYSLQLKQFSDVLGSLLIRRRRDRFLGGALSIGTRYSPQEGIFSRIDVGADVQLGSRTQLQVFSGYNGFAKQFDIQQFRVVRDLHCFNLYASYDAQRKEFRFDLALKAFPFVDSRLGQTALGEGFDPASGIVR